MRQSESQAHRNIVNCLVKPVSKLTYPKSFKCSDCHSCLSLSHCHTHLSLLSVIGFFDGAQFFPLFHLFPTVSANFSNYFETELIAFANKSKLSIDSIGKMRIVRKN